MGDKMTQRYVSGKHVFAEKVCKATGHSPTYRANMWTGMPEKVCELCDKRLGRPIQEQE